MVLEAWPRPRCFHRLHGDEAWTSVRPSLEVWQSPRLRPPGFDPDRFWADVPDPLRQTLRSMPAAQWEMLCFAARSREACELSARFPALALALTPLAQTATIVSRRPHRLACEQWASCPETQTLERLGFPGTRAIRRFLRRIEPAALTLGGLFALRATLDADSVHRWRLGHLPRVHAGVVALLGDRDAITCLDHHLLREVSVSEDEAREPQTVHRLRDCVLMLRAGLGTREPRPPRSRRALWAWHHRLVEELKSGAVVPEAAQAPQAPPGPRRAAAEWGTVPTPRHRRSGQTPSEFAPDPQMHRIESVLDLRHWARVFRNCATCYAQQLLAGRYEIFVHVPGPVMVGLKRAHDGLWVLDQMAGPRNEPPSDALRMKILLWAKERGVIVY